MDARLLTVAFFLATFANAQNIVFVAPAQNGNGNSWNTATNDLQAVLNSAQKGTEIWVAAGTYFPTSGKDRKISFEIKEGVQLFGGFAGTEKSIAERKEELHPTILSGNIGRYDAEDNSYNVVVMENVSSATVLDGFTVKDGYANGHGQSGERIRSGGGMFICATKSASPIIINCVFIGNFAKDGGAVYVSARNGGKASPSFTNCNFELNNADLDGGAVNLDGRAQGQNNTVFSACAFDNNTGNYGGALFCYGLNGESLPLMTNCRLSENSAYVKGGAIFQITTGSSGKIDVERLAFSNNSALDHETDNYTHYSVSTNEFATK